MPTPLPSTSSAIGQFVPPSALGPPSPLLADNIDLLTRDYADLFTGQDPVDAAVITALSTSRSSGAAVLEFGLAPPPSKMDGSHQLIVDSQVRAALKHLIDGRDVALLGVEVQIDDEALQTYQVAVNYRNLRALDGKTRTTAIPYPSQA